MIRTCVTGMHRSGTSMVCQLLTKLGADFGDPQEFYETDQWNAEGYFESRDVMDVNSILITGVPRNRGKLREQLSKFLYLWMPPPAKVQRRAPRVEAEMRRLAAHYHGKAIKDPRFCVTLPCWERLGVIDRYVLCLRHPEEVVKSLHRRQNIPLRLGYRFWDYHLRHLLDHAPLRRCALVSFEHLRDPNLQVLETQCVARFLGLELDEQQAAEVVGGVIKKTLVHCNATEHALPPGTAKLWEQAVHLHARRTGEIMMNPAPEPARAAQPI